MKKFVISWISFYDNILHSKVINQYEGDELEAYKEAYKALTKLTLPEFFKNLHTIEDFVSAAFDADGAINVIRVD